MANMSYCRFENTESDLADCVAAMWEADSLDELDLSSHERDAMIRMIKRCKQFLQMAQEFNLMDGDTEEFIQEF